MPIKSIKMKISKNKKMRFMQKMGGVHNLGTEKSTEIYLNRNKNKL